MMKIKVIVVGRTRLPFLREGEAFYLKRLRRYAHTDWVEVRPQRITRGRPVKEILKLEGKEIAKKICKGDFLIALGSSGRRYDSQALARHLERLFHGQSRICFIIGGPVGLSEEILQLADEALSLTSLTLTHEMCRLLLLEQLYRAFTIIRKEPYHK